MKNKPSDVPYCDVDETKIKMSRPKFNEANLKLLTEFIIERYSIHLKKDIELLPSPWSTNPVLSQVKFTNIRREMDRQTKEYIRVIAESGSSWKTRFWNTVMFRMYNHINPWNEVFKGVFEVSRAGSDPQYLTSIRNGLIEMLDSGKPAFTNAFNCGGIKRSHAFPEFQYKENDRMGDTFKITFNDGSSGYYNNATRLELKNKERFCDEYEQFIPMRFVRFITHEANVSRPSLHEEIITVDSQKEAYELITSIRGISRFLAYQIYVDLCYNFDFKFSENEFTVSGPGCDAGLDLLFDNKDGLSYSELIFWLRDNQTSLNIDFVNLMSDLPLEERKLSVMSIENCMCELGKYIKCTTSVNLGKPPKGRVGISKLVSNSGKTASNNEKAASTKKLW